jgi:group I intron endonuclease
MIKIYKHTNKINGKSYIGITKGELKRRWRKNGDGYKLNRVFYKAIKKYGWENFDHEVLELVEDYKEALLKESKYIEFYNSVKNGYNISEYSRNKYARTKAHKEKLSLKAKGQTRPEWHKAILKKNVMDYWSKKENVEKFRQMNYKNEYGNKPIVVFDLENDSVYEKKSIKSFAEELKIDTYIVRGAIKEKYSVLKKYYVFRRDDEMIWLL